MAFVALALAASGAAGAQQSLALDRLRLSLGGYYVHNDTTIGASALNDQYHGNINLEDDLGFKARNSAPRVRLDFLPGDSQGFSFDYFSINRSRSKALSSGISYHGNNYHASVAWAPVLQLGWRHAFSDQWRMYADASGVKKNGGHLNGHI